MSTSPIAGLTQDSFNRALVKSIQIDGTNRTDILIGGPGNDTLAGYGGDDFLFGGPGDDLMNGDHPTDGGQPFGNDVMYGGLGNDNVIGREGNDALFGGQGNDTVGGGNSDDLVDGGQGDDFVDGGPGADTVIGGAGNDTLYDRMETDADAFLFLRIGGGFGQDSINSFDDGLDQLQFVGYRPNQLVDVAVNSTPNPNVPDLFSTIWKFSFVDGSSVTVSTTQTGSSSGPDLGTDYVFI